jgi:hypothetical protein
MPQRKSKPKASGGVDGRVKAGVGVGVGVGVFALLGYFLFRPAAPAPVIPPERQPAYQELERRLNEVLDPKNARSEEQLNQIAEQMSRLSVPKDKMGDWYPTEAYKRYTERQADLKNLRAAVENLKNDCQRLSKDGQEVVRRKDAPNLPQRAREVLDRAKDLPDPGRDLGAPVGNSDRVRYATVFAFPSVKEAHAEWEAVKKTLEPLAKPERP